MLSAVLNNALEENSPNTEFNAKIRQILADLSDKEKALILRLCQYNEKTFMFPKWDCPSIAYDLGMTQETLKHYEVDFNIAKRVYALRDIISTELGTKVVREGIAVKQFRINALQEGFNRTESIIEQRKQHILFLAEEVISLKAQANVLKANLNEDNQNDYELLLARIHHIETKLIPGASSGMLNADGDFDVALANEQRKLLFDVAKEMGDIVARSNNTTTKKIQKTYSDETKALI